MLLRHFNEPGAVTMVIQAENICFYVILMNPFRVSGVAWPGSDHRASFSSPAGPGAQPVHHNVHVNFLHLSLCCLGALCISLVLSIYWEINLETRFRRGIIAYSVSKFTLLFRSLVTCSIYHLLGFFWISSPFQF